MKHSIISLIIALCCLISSLVALPSCAWKGERLYTTTYFDVFDTYLTVTVRAKDIGTAETLTEALHTMTQKYHEQFDIYHTYDGVNNLKSLNDKAGEPLKVSRDIIDILLLGKDIYQRTDGLVNIAMGGVLDLWHTALTDGGSESLPTEAHLREAGAHCDIQNIVIDEESMTVTLADPYMSVNVGAIAKGYVLSELYKYIQSQGHDHVLVDFGGQILAVGGKDDDTPWEVGVRDPHTDGVYQTLQVYDQVVVTSGADQRKVTIDGVTYHHIIHPKTLTPCNIHTSVTLVLPISDIAISDGLSTALFLCDQASGGMIMGEGERIYQ